jgi:DNA adenine methylase
LKRVVILNQDGVDCMLSNDSENSLMYCDPPYLHETRASPDVYEHEMTESDHRRFLAAAKSLKAKVAVSGYPSALYDEALASWNKHVFDVPNNSAGGPSKRRMKETLWVNW